VLIFKKRLKMKMRKRRKKKLTDKQMETVIGGAGTDALKQYRQTSRQARESVTFKGGSNALDGSTNNGQGNPFQAASESFNDASASGN
jgi:bacteriocin-like protein